MFRSFLLILSLVSLSACVTNPLARINAIRAEQLPKVKQKMAAMHLEPGSHAYIRIFKEEHILETWIRNEKTGRYQPYKAYPICTYSGKLGPKQREGDHQSPEGFYDITEEWMWPQSKYHLAMNIGFPNEYDRAKGRTGSFLMIHGGCKSEGCYAITDPAIEEVYLLVEQSLRKGNTPVPVHIFPFKMTEANMVRYQGTHWMPFWRKLKEGYDAFEKNKVPPQVYVRNGNYVVKPQVFVKRYEG